MPFISRNAVSMLASLVVASEMEASSAQNLVTVMSILLLAYPWLVSAITWSMKSSMLGVAAANSGV